MFSWKGNVNGSAISPAQQLPTILDNFRLVNVSGGTATVNVYLIDNLANLRAIAPFGNSIAAGNMYSESSSNIVVLASEQIRVQTSGSFDYDFNFDNLAIPSNK